MRITHSSTCCLGSKKLSIETTNLAQTKQRFALRQLRHLCSEERAFTLLSQVSGVFGTQSPAKSDPHQDPGFSD